MRPFLIVLCCIIACFVFTPAFAQWTAYQGDASHDGYVPVSLDPLTFSFLWQRDFSTSILNPVTAGNGEVFVSTSGYFSDGMGLQALDALTGETKWSQEYGSIFSVSPPAYANGKVYIQTCNNTPGTYLWAYDANTGNLVYRSPYSAQWENYYAPTIYDNTVYINGGADGGAYAFDDSNGKQKWFIGLGYSDAWTPTVDQNYAYAYIGNDNAFLSAIDRVTGRIAFQISDLNYEWTGWGTNQAVALGTKNDAFIINGNRLICFDLRNRYIKWQSTRAFGSAGQATVANGVVYAIDGGALDAIDELSGKWLWSWVPPSGDLAGTIIATKTHVLISTADTTYAVDLNSHTATWSYPLGGALALSNHSLYIANTSDEMGTLAAIGIPLTATYPVSPTGLAIAVSNPSGNPASMSDNTVTISGTANELDESDAVLGTGHLASVTWSNDKGGRGIGCYDSYWNVPTSWSASGIVLQEGDNIITVTATDLWGNTATTSKTIRYEAPIGASIKILSPTSNLYYSTNAIPVLSGTANAIYALGTAAGDTGLAYVRWSNNHGDSGTCDGTGTWTASDLILYEGINTVDVTATDVAGNSATATITITYIPSSPGYNTWSEMAMISLPIIPNTPDPKQAVGFEGNLWYAYISGYGGYGNDPTHLSWFTNPAINTLGRGFWAYVDLSNDNIPCGEVPDQSQPKTIHLNRGWNIIGNPFIKSVPWNTSAITVRDRYQVTRTLARSKDIVNDSLWGWNCNNWEYYAVCDPALVPDAYGTIEPWLGYWIRAFDECDLIIPAP